MEDLYIYIWVFPKIEVPQNGWFIMVPNPIRIDDLVGFPTIFGGPPICNICRDSHCLGCCGFGILKVPSALLTESNGFS